MDLSFLIPSKMRRLVLAYFCKNPKEEVHVRELARRLNSAPQLVYRELVNLESWGLLFSFAQGHQRVFRINPRFVFLAGLESMFKTQEEIGNFNPTVSTTYNAMAFAKKIKKITIPPELDLRLKKQPKKLRAYDETKSLTRIKNSTRV